MWICYLGKISVEARGEISAKAVEISFKFREISVQTRANKCENTGEMFKVKGNKCSNSGK